jgi:hypothetical protein
MQRKTANVTMDGRIVTVPRRELELAQVIARLRREIREEVREEFEREIASLRREVSELKAKSMRYEDAWQDGQMHTPGAVVTCRGALWRCVEPTHVKPGDGASGWKLILKSGAFDRDDDSGRRTSTSQRHHSHNNR